MRPVGAGLARAGQVREERAGLGTRRGDGGEDLVERAPYALDDVTPRLAPAPCRLREGVPYAKWVQAWTEIKG